MGHTGNPAKGVLLVACGTLLFAMADTITKHLASVMPVPIVVLVRYIVNVAVLLIVFYPRHRAALWRTRRTGLVTVRALCLCAASLSMGLALRVMPVAEAISIVYISPFAVMLLAGPLLGEKVSVLGWIGAGVGFAGLLLIVHPGGSLDLWGVCLCLINAGFSTAYNLMSRSLSRTETTNAMLFHTAVVGVVVFGVMSWGQWHGPMPGLLDMGLLILLGLLLSGGHFLATAAAREAPASVLAPVTYVQIFWSGVLGWLIFAHVPDGVTGLGMVLVMLAGVAVALRTRFVSEAA